MLQLFKNNVVTESTLAQALVRQKELEFYTNNYWIWGGTSTVMAGFVFAQLTNPVPEGTSFYLETVYLVCTATCLSLDLCVITWTVLCCMWGPGMALRGPEGMKSFHQTVDFMKGEQQSIYMTFVASVISYFLSTCCIVWVYPSRREVNFTCMCTLGFFLVTILWLQVKLELEIGGSLFQHDGPDGRITGLERFEDVADLDQYMATVVTPEQAAQCSVLQPGFYGSHYDPTNSTLETFVPTRR